MLRIYADFNCCDEQGRVRLNIPGSLADLKSHSEEIADGLRVILYMTDEFEVEGVLVFDRIWLGIPDLDTIQYTQPKSRQN